jgi:anti-sigma factor RsiW
MDKLSRLSTEQRGDLVAYLDGELEEDTTAAIENVLAYSNVARNDVEMLARTYDLLDQLPRLSAPEKFTEQTMTTIRLDQVRPDITEAEWYRRLRRGSVFGAWTLAMVAASALGFQITNAWIPNDEEILVEDFEVIQELDVYMEVGRYEFLEDLWKEPELARAIAPGGGREAD